MTNIEGFCFTNINSKVLDLFNKLKIDVSIPIDNSSYYTISNFVLYRVSLRDFYQLSIEQVIGLLERRLEDNIWWKNLNVGDEVEIAPRDYNSDDYPFSYADVMAEEYSGSIATIERIEKTFGTTGYKCSNGDENCYYLDIDEQEFMWHSSMFVTKDATPVKKIKLTPLSIKLLIN